jgi:nucleoside-triphosphatase
MSAPPRILLEGRPGSGKTTAIIRLAELLREAGVAASGFFTRERRTGGRRTGFELETLDGRHGLLASVDIRGGPRVGRYGVSLQDLETIVVPALVSARDGEVVLVDELGKMELASPAFSQAVAALFDRPVPIVATVQTSRHPFTDELRRRAGTEVIRLTAANRERVPDDVAARLT